MGSPAAGRNRNGTGAFGPVRKALGQELIADLEKLCGRPTIGLWDVAWDLMAIAAAAIAGHLIGHVAGPLLAVCYIGVRQRHLSNLGHECVHSKLMATRRANRIVGHLLTGLLGEGFEPYRSSHYVHHAKLGSDDDPMFQSYRAGNIRAAVRAPCRRAFVLRAIVRNALWRLPKSLLLAAQGDAVWWNRDLHGRFLQGGGTGRGEGLSRALQPHEGRGGVIPSAISGHGLRLLPSAD